MSLKEEPMEEDCTETLLNQSTLESEPEGLLLEESQDIESWESQILDSLLDEEQTTSDASNEASAIGAPSCSSAQPQFNGSSSANASSKAPPRHCPFCGRAFYRSWDLKRHLAHHTGEKPFSCKLCHKRFSWHADLLRHNRVHSDAKPYECKHCEGVAFKDITALKRHQRRVHSIGGPPIEFICPICRKVLTRNANLQAHIFFSHNSSRPDLKIGHDPKNAKHFQCSQCPYTANRRSYIEVHIFHKHVKEEERNLVVQEIVARVTERNPPPPPSPPPPSQPSLAPEQVVLVPLTVTVPGIVIKEELPDSSQLIDMAIAATKAEQPTEVKLEEGEGAEGVPHCCHLCSWGQFKTEEALRVHLQKEHQLGLPTEKLAQDWPCPLCGRLFARKMSLKVHVYFAHNLEASNVLNFEREAANPKHLRCAQCSFWGKRHNMESHYFYKHVKGDGRSSVEKIVEAAVPVARESRQPEKETADDLPDNSPANSPVNSPHAIVATDLAQQQPMARAYYCPQCPDAPIFLDKASLKQHVRQQAHHRCFTCGRTFARLCNLQAHCYFAHNPDAVQFSIARDDLNPKRFRCPQCSVTAKQRSSIQVHLFNRHMSAGDAQGSSTEASSAEIKEEPVDSDQETMTVALSPAAFESAEGQQPEEPRPTGGEGQPVAIPIMVAIDGHSAKPTSLDQSTMSLYSVFRCTECGLNTNTLKELDAHHAAHHQRSLIRCPICRFPLASEKGLHHHMRLKHPSAYMKCQFCGETFSAERSLRLHEIVCQRLAQTTPFALVSLTGEPALTVKQEEEEEP